MEKFKLARPIRNAADTEDIKEISIKSEDQMTAADFYNVTFGADGDIKLGGMADAIANLCGLTSGQVASMHPKDYIALSGMVGKFIQ